MLSDALRCSCSRRSRFTVTGSAPQRGHNVDQPAEPLG